MKPYYEFNTEQANELRRLVSNIQENPYSEYINFNQRIIHLVNNNKIPKYFIDLCKVINKDRINNRHIHLIRNCPIDYKLPELNHDNPVNDKYKRKKTFISEAFMALMANLLESPLLSYKMRNKGDFFTDVVPINRYKGKRTTGFTYGDLVYHNDRTCHAVRADYISLLGLRCPQNDIVCTNYIDNVEIMKHISKQHISTLKQCLFYTEVDELTKENNRAWIVSDRHSVILSDGRLRFQGGLTKVTSDASPETKEALEAFKCALISAKKQSHCIKDGDLFMFANQYGLHNRECIGIHDSVGMHKRWLLKTYNFKNKATADQYKDHWAGGVYGCISD